MSGYEIQDATQLILYDAAKVLFDYLSVSHKVWHADLVVGFGVADMRVPDRCIRLYHLDFAPILVFTGGVGSGSEDMQEPEAIVFKKMAVGKGVPSESIYAEPLSTNTLENVLFSRELLKEKSLSPEAVILVAQSYRQRRVWLTCRKWLEGIRLINLPPPARFKEEIERFGGLKAFSSRLTGEIDRIITYGGKGDLFLEELPDTIKKAYGELQKGIEHTKSG